MEPTVNGSSNEDPMIIWDVIAPSHNASTTWRSGLWSTKCQAIVVTTGLADGNIPNQKPPGKLACVSFYWADFWSFQSHVIHHHEKLLLLVQFFQFFSVNLRKSIICKNGFHWAWFMNLLGFAWRTRKLELQHVGTVKQLNIYFQLSETASRMIILMTLLSPYEAIFMFDPLKVWWATPNPGSWVQVFFSRAPVIEWFHNGWDFL